MHNFNEIAGHRQIINSLQSSVKHGRVSHAYIFSGEAGMGKKLLAKTFAKTLQCEAIETGEACEPCGRCRSCLTFESGNQPDVFYVKPTKTKAIGVDDIREQVSENLVTRPFSSAYKIFIIDHADEMTAQAQNALLKSIEEPAVYAVFILLSRNIHLFLPTVLSRCVTYKLKPVPEPDVRAYLLRVGVPSANAGLLSEYAAGSIGRALALANDTEFLAMRGEITKAAEKLERADLAETFAVFPVFEKYKERIQEALDILYIYYHDARAPFAFMDSIDAAKRRLKQNANFQLTIEVMLLDIKRGITNG